MKKLAFVGVCLAIFTNISFGQVQLRKNSIFRVDRTDLGLGAGATFYLGDYNEFIPFTAPRYYGSIHHRYSFNILYSLRTSVTVGQIAGNSNNYKGYMPYYDEPSYLQLGRPTVKFSRMFIDFNTGIELNLRPFEPVIHRVKETFTPYLFLGVGVVLAYPDSYRSEPDANTAMHLYPDVYGTTDENASSIQAIHIPIGLGVKWSPKPRWTLAFEWQFKKTFNDNIDRFNNINPSEVNNGKKGSAFLNTDWISLFGVSISYRLAPKQKCPAINTYIPPKRSLKGKNSGYDDYDKSHKKKK
ncbi:MAG: DUF6089 family protein [Prevotellaceae bacterium]|jgi:hypothetical protein|nr:DUF6089 family protein [Prevotellaceae bacterium]